ncbi:MAG TPA: hypothetical protein VGE79_10745 [Niastella sp.]
MRKLVPFALLLCAFISIAGFTFAQETTQITSKSPLSITWPITGTTGSTQGTVYYTVTGYGNTPSNITFSKTPGGQELGTFYFSQYVGSSAWYSYGMKATLGIDSVRLGIFADGSGYTIDFFSPF